MATYTFTKYPNGPTIFETEVKSLVRTDLGSVVITLAGLEGKVTVNLDRAEARYIARQIELEYRHVPEPDLPLDFHPV